MDESDDAMDSAALSAGFFKQINGGDMSMLGQGLIGNSAMGLGAISNAQQAAAWNAATLAHSPAVTKSSYHYKEGKQRVELNVKITQAENGFIVYLNNYYGEVHEPHIALTIEDVMTVITSQLASRMLDKAE